MSEVNKLLFIVNKFSGGGYKPQLEGKIIAACKKYNIECFIEFTTGPGHAAELAKEATTKKIDGVIAVGGDGTVNEVARGLVHSSTPMGILPKGSGNGLARHLGMSMRMGNALKQILTGKITPIDTFILNDKLSVNVSGLGFDGHVANLFSKGKKRGLRGYTKLVTREYFRFKEFPFEVRINGTEPLQEKAFMIAFANSSQYGNNARVSPKSSVKDEALQLIILKKIPLYRGLVFGYRMFAKKLKPGKRYQSHSFKNVVLQTQEPVAFHIDGEPCGHANEFKVDLLPKSLHMIVPANLIDNI
jgi:YegS/Rv2252/BmrU family lipid kinase